MPSPDLNPDPPPLPPAWIDRVRTDFADHPTITERILASTRGPRWRGVRFHALRGRPGETRQELEASGIEFVDVPWHPHLAVVSQDAVDRITSTEAWRSGRVVVQSPTSVLAAIALEPAPEDRILDLCAAPGGKTATIADLGGSGVRLVANDRSRRRVHRMRALFDQLGVEAEIRTGAGERLHPRDEGTFDRVLVDVPCSGEGRFRQDRPTSTADWTLRATRRLASTQKALLHAAIHAVRPGGVVIYATCTLGRIENEAVIARALSRYGDGPAGIEPDPLPDGLPPGIPLLDPPGDPKEADRSMRRWCPDPDGAPWSRAMDGFFVARLRRRGGSSVRPRWTS